MADEQMQGVPAGVQVDVEGIAGPALQVGEELVGGTQDAVGARHIVADSAEVTLGRLTFARRRIRRLQTPAAVGSGSRCR